MEKNERMEHLARQALQDQIRWANYAEWYALHGQNGVDESVRKWADLAAMALKRVAQTAVDACPINAE